MKYLAVALLLCLLGGCTQAGQPAPSATASPSQAAAEHNAMAVLDTIDAKQVEEPLQPLAHLPAKSSLRMHLRCADGASSAAVVAFAAVGAPTLATWCQPQMLVMRSGAEMQLQWYFTAEPQPFKLFVAFVVNRTQAAGLAGHLVQNVVGNPKDGQACAGLYQQLTAWQNSSHGTQATAAPASPAPAAGSKAPAFDWKVKAWSVGYGKSEPGVLMFHYGVDR